MLLVNDLLQSASDMPILTLIPDDLDISKISRRNAGGLLWEQGMSDGAIQIQCCTTSGVLGNPWICSFPTPYALDRSASDSGND